MSAESVRTWWSSKNLSSKYGPIIILLGISVVMFVLVLATHRSFYSSSDNLFQAYPWYQKFSQVLHSGHLPLWDANVFGGHSFTGDFQTGVFYPINLLIVAIFGSGHGIATSYLELLVVIHFFIAALGMYLLTKALGLRSVASLSAGITYALSGVVLARASQQTCIFFGLALIPLGIYGFVRYLEKRRPGWLLLSGFIFGSIILAGHIQPYIHGLIILFAYWVFVAIRRTGKPPSVALPGLVGLAVIVVVSLVVALPQLLLSAQYLPHSLRWTYEGYKAFNQVVSYNTFATVLILHPENLINFVNPNWSPVIDANILFLGLPALVLLLIGLLQRSIYSTVRPWREQKWFLLSLGLFGLLAAVGYYSFVAKIIYLVPILNQVRELARYVILVQFSLSILVGVTVQAILQLGPKGLTTSTRQYLLIIGGLTSLTGLYYVFSSNRPFGLDFGLDVLLAGLLGLILVFAQRSWRLEWPILTVMLLGGLLNVLMMVPVSIPAAGAAAYYADTPVINFLASEPYGSYRTLVLGDAIPVNSGDVYKIQTIGGYGATLYQPYADFLHQDRHDLRVTPDYQARQLDDLGTKYVVSKDKLNLPVVFSDTKSGITVYQRLHYLPKLFKPMALKAVGQASGIDFKIISYTDESQSYQVTNYQGGPLMLTEMYYPGWKAYVDGSPIALGPATGTDAALLDRVNLPAGTHTLTLKYLAFN